MESLEESLDILGLADGASWDEINAAYKDLVRVWHPDRFQTDDRLRKRAEEQTRLLNGAMETLRKGYKEHKPKKPRPQSAQARPEPRVEQEKPAETNSMWQQTFGGSGTSTTFAPAPFLVYQTLGATLRRMALAAALGSLGVWLLLFTKNQGREQAALGCVITVFAVQSFVRNVLVLATHRPLLIIDRRGVTTLESGLVGWAELNRIWTTIQARTYCIAIRFSDSYLQKQPFFVRWLLKVRHFLRHTHMTIPGNGFDVHPNDIIRAIELRHLSGDVQPVLPKEVKLPTRVRVARFLALAAAAIPVIRMLLRFPVSEQEILMYLAAFAIFQAVALLGTPVKAAR